MFHSMLTWRELDQACFLHFQCHLSPPPPLLFFWLTLSLKSSYFHLFSLPTRHPHMCTYIISPMKTGKMNKKLLAFVDWLVSEPSQRCISLGHMSFAFGGLYVKWGNQPFEFQENSFFLFFYFNFFSGRGTTLFLNFLFSKVCGTKDAFDHYHPPAEFGFKGNGGVLSSFLCVTCPLVLFFIELRTVA